MWSLPSSPWPPPLTQDLPQVKQTTCILLILWDSGFVGFDPISFHGLMDSWIEKDIDMNKGHARRVKPHIHLQYEMLNNDVHQSMDPVMLRLPTSLKPKRCPGVKDCGACAVERIWNGQNLTDLGANGVTDSKSAELEAFRKRIGVRRCLLHWTFSLLIMAYICVFHVTAQLVHVFDAEIP